MALLVDISSIRPGRRHGWRLSDAGPDQLRTSGASIRRQQFPGRVDYTATAAGLGMRGHQIMTGATPAIGSGASDCGTSPSIGGNDSAGRVTVGAGNGGQCTITFATSWPNPPVCSAFNETTGNLVRPTADFDEQRGA